MRTSIKATALVAMQILLATTAFGADEPKATSTVVPLVTRDLAGIAGKEVTMLTVEYPPGHASPSHRHNATTYVYVLEGSVIMQVKGQEAVTLTPGQIFYESPSDIHSQAANASKTQPAKILVFMVKDKGAPVTIPAPQ